MFLHRYCLATFVVMALAAIGISAPAFSETFSLALSNPSPTPGQEFIVTVNTTALAANTQGIRVKFHFTAPDPILEFLGTDPAGSAVTGCGAGGVTYPAGSFLQATSLDGDAIFGATAPVGQLISGSGCMVAFRFRVKTSPTPAPGAHADLTLLAACELTRNNNSTDLAILGPTATVSVPLPVSGTVTYWNCSASQRAVPKVTVTLTQGAYTASDVSDNTTGAYSIPGVSGVAATLTFVRKDPGPPNPFDPGLPSDVKDAIGGPDVGAIMAFYLGLNPLDLCPLDVDHCPTTGFAGIAGFPARLAGDVTHGSIVNAYDAAIVLAVRQFADGTLATFPADYDLNTMWIFRCDTKSLGTPTGPVSYNPIAILTGDANGSYTESTKPYKPFSGMTLAIAGVQSTAAKVTVPLELKNAQKVLGLDARIVYDPRVLRFVEATVPSDEPQMQVWGRANDGILSIVSIGLGKYIEGSRTVALMTFERVDPNASEISTPLLISRANVEDEPVILKNGYVSTSPTAVKEVDWTSVKNLFR